MTTIPIVLASDKNGIFQMYTTILSAIENKNQDSFYDFYCLIPSNFSKYVNNKFLKLTKKYKNISIKFKKMGNLFSDIKMQIPHITSPTFYRLKIADLLPNYDKAIYLDIDTIVLKDLQELYNINLEDNYIGGVHSINYVNNYKDNKSKSYYDSIGMPNMDYYINAGVILWNLKQIRKDDLTTKFLELSKNTYKYMDQDIINLACYGKIKHIDFKYNTMTSIKQHFFNNLELRQLVYDFYGEHQAKLAIDNPVIIHYASSEKPWTDKNLWLSKYWFKYSKKCPFKIVNTNNYKQTFINQTDENKFKKTMFWGASLFLEDLINNKKIKKHKTLGIIDKNTNIQGQKFKEFEIFSPESLSTLKPEIIIFSIVNNNIAIYESVKKYLNENYPKIKLLPNAFSKK